MKGKFCEYDENHFCQNKGCDGCAIYKAMTVCRFADVCKNHADNSATCNDDCGNEYCGTYRFLSNTEVGND